MLDIKSTILTFFMGTIQCHEADSHMVVQTSPPSTHKNLFHVAKLKLCPCEAVALHFQCPLSKSPDNYHSTLFLCDLNILSASFKWNNKIFTLFVTNLFLQA